MTKYLTFLTLWPLVGFTTGTATLLGPVRWLTEHARRQGWSVGAEDLGVRLVIAGFVVGSALVAIWLTRMILASPRRHVKVGLFAFAAVAAGGNLWMWMSPEVMGASMGAESQVGSSFTFGAYATEERMRELKAEGYTGVVSLLHPIVAPFETKLIADGKAAAERVGIRYIHVPMLPWVGDNSKSLARIEDLARNPDGGRYYVHCYLGKDRVRLVKHLIALHRPDARIRVSAELSEHIDRRYLTDKPRFERGEVVQAADDVWVVPYPTDDEFMSYILPGTHGRVVSLLDPANPGDQPWIDKERKLLSDHGIDFDVRPLPVTHNDPRRVLELAREVAGMPRPVVVHAFLSPGSGRSPAAEAFVQAIRTDLPPLPPSLFLEPMGQEKVRVIAPNLSVGPRPRALDFKRYLQPRGVRRVVYIGDPDSPEAGEDAEACRSAGLPWRAMTVDSVEPEIFRTGGPWYVYGPGLAELEPELAAALGPAVPAHVAIFRPERDEPMLLSIVSFARKTLPDLRSVILLAPLLLLYAGIAAAFAGWLRSDRRVRTPYTRKIFHFSIFTMAGVLHLSGGLPVVAMFGGIVSGLVVYAVVRGDGFGFYEAMARPSDAPRRTLFVVVPLITTAAGGLLGNFLFGAYASIGYLVAGWGDAIAEPVGTRWGRHRYRVPSIAGVMATRSLEGSAAVLIVGGLAAFFGLSLAGTAPAAALGIALACGAAGALVEAFSNHGLDNLTVQLAAAGTAYFFLV